MVVRIYGSTDSVCTQRVMLCLLEKGVEFEIVRVDVNNLEHKRAEYLAKQPFGQVPYIEDGDLKIYESRAIIRYYAAKHADLGPKLLGRTLEESARIDQWLNVEAINYDSLVFPIVFNTVILPILGKPADKTAAHAHIGTFEKVLDIYEKQLSKTKYLAGDEFTLADLTHIPSTRRILEDCQLGHLLAGRKHLRVWWEDIASRPALKKVVELERSY